MNVQAALESFERLLSNDGFAIERLTVAQGIGAMLAFYRNQRFENCLADADGDMLLYQWGISPGDHADYFEVDVTRQFILDGESDDEDFWQLSLTFKFVPSESLRAIESGNKWCPLPHPKAVDDFECFVHDSEAFRMTGATDALAVELGFFNAG
ncbi:MAG: hypothetical protein KDA88_14990 [Planctomycetaceae bacterium]|nr:hypothetical protein [Planctomycetaceae bacterium]MCB9949833.1 hypothetical protein [Planctomycetaceae bacterium]